jgi:hypothetical protein
MPAPRIFASQSEPRAQWTHVLASVLALSGPQHRVALMREFLDEDIPGVETAIVREFAPAGDDVIDIVVQDRDKAWAFAVQTSLAFQGDIQGRLSHAATSLSDYGRVIVMGITPNSETQLSLFNTSNPKHQPLMSVIDLLNKKIGKNKVKFATQSTGRQWKMKQEKLSKSFTTRIDEIITIQL